MGSPLIQELPEQERPREKLSAHGAAALSDAELIAIMLGSGLRGCSVIDLARQLVAKYGSLAALARCPVAELMQCKGLGLAKATQLAAAFALASRLAREALTRQRLDSPELIHAFLGPEMRLLTQESLRVLMLDTKLHLIRVHEVSLGTLNESLAHPREVLRPVLLQGAYAFILVHNHPSGDPTPSEADRRTTVRLREAASLVQVNLFDHVILGTSDGGRLPYFSFKEAGLMT